MLKTIDGMPDTISQSGVHFMLHFQMKHKTEAMSALAVAHACTILSFGIRFYHSSFVGVGKISTLSDRLILVYVSFSIKEDIMNFSSIL